MTRYFIPFMFLLFSFQGKSCGFDPDYGYYFYNLFYQTNIIPQSLYPFIYGQYRDNYDTYKDKLSPDEGNENLWNQLSSNNPAVEKYWDFVNTINDLDFTFGGDSWDYVSIQSSTADFEYYIDEGFKLFEKEKIKQLKQRYAYQIVKLMFYSRKYEDAIKFFDNFVKPVSEKNEIYYYTLNYIGGCYYRLNNYEKAAYYYILVFYNSIDKKTSAYTSYGLCTNHDAEGKEFIKNIKEKEAYITLKSIRGFSDSYFGLEEMFKLNPNSDFFELLFVRSLNLLEKETLPTISMDMKKFPVIDKKNKKRIKRLMDISEKMYINRKTKDKDFWLLANSYLYFLDGKIGEADFKLYYVKDKRFEKQKKSLAVVYKVFSWGKIGENEEDFLLATIDEKNFFIKDAFFDWFILILERIGHIYLKNNQIAKSFLMHNNVENIERIFSLPLIDDLIAFIEKPNKSKFEKLMIKKRFKNKTKKYLLYVKGLYYLHNSQPEIAVDYLKDYQHNKISWRIFSNNTQEVELSYQNYENNIRNVMTDSIARILIFSFIKDDFSFYDLARNLVTLDSMTKNSEKKWKRKLAHYLLGNYYYNISNSGIYRYLLVNRQPYNSFQKYFYSPYRKMIFTQEMIDDKSAYSLSDATTYLKLYFGFAKKAMKHYKMVLTLSENRELNARTLYLMAKCELNNMYNADNSYYDNRKMYDGAVNKKTVKYKTSFEKLKNDYQDTEFYKMIIEECSFFKYYCSI